MTSLTSKFKLNNSSLGFAARAGLIANQPVNKPFACRRSTLSKR